MRDYLIIAGIIVGVILLCIRKKTKNAKLFLYAGLILMAVCLAFALPDVIRGVVDGYNDGRR